jgi:hypothetical protein
MTVVIFLSLSRYLHADELAYRISKHKYWNTLELVLETLSDIFPFLKEKPLGEIFPLERAHKASNLICEGTLPNTLPRRFSGLACDCFLKFSSDVYAVLENESKFTTDNYLFSIVPITAFHH